MKKVTYQGEIFEVKDTQTYYEDTFDSTFNNKDEVWYNLKGIGWVKKSQCTHWLSGWFYKFFKSDFIKIVLIICGIYLGWQIGNIFRLIFKLWQ